MKSDYWVKKLVKTRKGKDFKRVVRFEPEAHQPLAEVVRGVFFEGKKEGLMRKLEERVRG